MLPRPGAPSRVACRLLAAVLPANVAGRSTLGDLIEEFHHRPAGLRRRLWFWSASAELIARYLPGRGGELCGGVMRDLVYGLRLARRHPWHVAAALLSLTLAIGASTAAFTIANTAWLRPTLAADSSLVRIWRHHATGASAAWPRGDFSQMRALTQRIALEAAVESTEPLGPAGEPGAAASIKFVTGGYFAAAKARPALGRLLNADDDRPGSEPVLVLDHSYWRRQFGADRQIVGRTLSVSGASFTVVGVADRDFVDPLRRPVAAWVPLAALERVTPGKAASVQPGVIGRVRPGVAIADVNRELDSLLTTIAQDPTAPRATAFEATPVFTEGEIAANRKILMATFSSVALLLILASANVSNLQLAGATIRRHEIAVRLSCGATGRRVMRQVLTESALFSAASCGAGLLVARWLAPLLATGLSVPGADLSPDLHVYVFVAVAAVATALGTGLAPAYYAARDDVSTMLSGVARQGAAVTQPARAKALFTLVQAAAAVVLVSLAALQVRALLQIAWINPGVDTTRLLAISGPTPRTPDDEVRLQKFWPAALARLRDMPGIERASLATYAPLNVRLGNPDSMAENATDADYFATTGLAVTKGRSYSAAEVLARDRVAVISEALARRWWHTDDPLGEMADRIDDLYRGFRVIGITRDAFVDRVSTQMTPVIYVPYSAEAFSQIVVRTASPVVLAPAVKASLHELAPTVSINTSVIDDVYQRQFERPRRFAELAAFVALVVLLLSGVGIFGVTAFGVRMRTREIGIRLALGAERAEVMRLLVRDAMVPVVGGLAIGTGVALLADHALAGPLYGISERDPLALGGATFILLCAALTAVVVPTRRAAQLDPARVLRDA